MDNRTQETKARIETQKSLKDAVAHRVQMSRQIIKDAPNIWKGSRGSVARKLEAYFDKYTERRLIFKTSNKDKRNPKHKCLSWTYLEYDHETPFHHFENQLFPIGEMFFSSRKPHEHEKYELPIFISRHCLERVFEREGKHNLSQSLNSLAEFIYILDSPEDNNWQAFFKAGKCILISNNAYVVISFSKEDQQRCFNDEEPEPFFIIESYLPITHWNNTKHKNLVLLLAEIKSKTDKTGKPICIVEADVFNSNKVIEPEQSKYIY